METIVGVEVVVQLGNSCTILSVRSYSLHEARSGFSKLVERALAGEPQRVTRYGKEAVVIVSEADWKSTRPDQGLGHLLLAFGRKHGFKSSDFVRPYSQKRPLGSDFE